LGCHRQACLQNRLANAAVIAVTPVPAKPATTKKKRVAVKKRARNQRTAKEVAIDILGKEKSGFPLQGSGQPHARKRLQNDLHEFLFGVYQVLHNARNKVETFDVDAKTGNWVVRK
jgi:hypothetical protein